jgi:hypothetical protein
MGQDNPQPSFTIARYRKPCLPNQFEYLEQLAGDLFTVSGNHVAFFPVA